MRKIYAIILMLVMILSTMSTSYAIKQTPGVERCEVIGSSNNVNVNHDFVMDGLLRGDEPPTLTTTLPYTLYGNIGSYTYSAKKYKPSASGEIYTKLNGQTYYASNVRVIIELYDSSNERILKYDCGRGHLFENVSVRWYNLQPNEYYYHKVRINALVMNERFDFSLACKEVNS